MRSRELKMLTEAFASLRTNRRDFIKKTALGLGFLALPELVAVQKEALAKQKIVVVGGGVAGLTAAYLLKKQGIRVEVFEGSFRVGGRMFTYKDIFGEGISTDLGGEFIDENHHELIDLATELGVSFYNLKEDTLKEQIFYFEGKHFSQEDLSKALLPYMPKLEEDINQLPSEYHYSKTEKFMKYDKISISEYLDSISMSGWVRQLIETTLTIEYGMDANLQSALNFLTILARVEKPNNTYKLLGDGHETYKYIGGAESLIQKLNTVLEKQIKLNHLLEKIKQNKESKYELWFNTTTGTQKIIADIVLIAIPFSVLRNISLAFPMTKEKKLAINELGYNNAHKYIMGFNKKVWRTEHQQQGYFYSDTDAQAGWDSSQMQMGEESALTVFMGGSSIETQKNNTETELNNMLLEGIDKIYPKTKEAFNDKTLQFIWKDYPYSLGAYSVYLKGQWSKFVGAEAEPCGNVFFAGEHTSTDFQGFMNGAVQSAQRAVKQINEILKIKK